MAATTQTPPSTKNNAVTPATTDTAQIREMLGSMKATLNNLNATFQTLNDQSAKVSTLGPDMKDVAVQIYNLRRQMHKQGRKNDERVKDVKNLVQTQLREKIASDLKEWISESIVRETKAQVHDQVKLQIKEHLHVTLEEQVVGSKNQLVEVRHALANSEARRENSIISTDNLNDALQVVLKPDGTKSTLYPANLNSLFAYSPAMLANLLKDHDLAVHHQREKNLNRFMAHIGIPFQLVPVPDGM
ncbi:hypothetical protein C8Q75DRAFT_811282 [Abortiporus biennis]|nr:hypothetical protein C8Q75DRAFT_811282 [Abortiporus biennis]